MMKSCPFCWHGSSDDTGITNIYLTDRKHVSNDEVFCGVIITNENPLVKS